jgi:acyl carrier protein
MTKPGSSVERRVIEFVAAAADVTPDTIDPAAELASLGMGSLERLECVLNIEDAFRVELDEADLRKLRTVRELISAVDTAVGRGRQPS